MGDRESPEALAVPTEGGLPSCQGCLSFLNRFRSVSQLPDAGYVNPALLASFIIIHLPLYDT